MQQGLVIPPAGVGEVLDLGFNLARRNFRPLVVVGAAGMVPTQFVGTLGTLGGSLEGSAATAVGLGFLGTIISTFGIFLGQGAVAIACSNLVAPGRSSEESRKPHAVWDCYRAALGALPSLILLGLVGALLSIPLVILFPLGIFLLVRWSLSWTVILVERGWPFRALARSWELTRGSWWHTFLVTAAAALIISLLSYSVLGVLGLGAALSSVAAGGGTLTAIVVALGSVLINLVLTPFSMGIAVVLYYELRARTEGFDLQQRALQVTSAT